MLSSYAIAEEVIQETRIALVTGTWKFDGRSCLRTWLFTVMANIAKDRGIGERRDNAAVIAFAGATVDPARFHDEHQHATIPGGSHRFPFGARVFIAGFVARIRIKVPTWLFGLTTRWSLGVLLSTVGSGRW
jgi:hypothetical protein